jgi:DnaJ family protein C protein 7
MICLRQFEKAKAAATELYKVDARNSEILRVRGLSLYYTGNLELAQKHFSEVLRFDPDNQKCSVLFKMVRALEKKKVEGNALFSENKNAEAIVCYSDALLIDPLNTDYNSVLYSNRSAAYVKLRKWQQALDDCNKCLDGKPAFTKAKVRRAACLLELRMFEECVRDYTDLLKEDPQNADYRAGVQKAKLELKKSKRKDYYAILGIGQSANNSDIKKAYRKKALEWHPDKNSETEEKKKEAEAKFKDITEAHETLSDDTKKRRYDSGVDLEDEHEGHSHGGRGGMDMDNIFQMFFQQQQQGGGGHGHGGGRGRGGFGF